MNTGYVLRFGSVDDGFWLRQALIFERLFGKALGSRIRLIGQSTIFKHFNDDFVPVRDVWSKSERRACEPRDWDMVTLN